MRNAETQQIATITVLTGVYMDTPARKFCLFGEAVIAKARAAMVVYELPW